VGVGVERSVSGRLTHARRQLAASFGNDLDWAGLLGLSCLLAFLAYRNRDARDHDYPSIGESARSLENNSFYKLDQKKWKNGKMEKIGDEKRKKGLKGKEKRKGYRECGR